ncbi:inovirus-type Gp2 protein [Mariprofundus ferrooxydans]|uniref:YagK/YfjJ domain-containing protein n=1 Tax=Mariprofundus ferrooxydans TaxID=314344 RepID=UPI0009D9AD95|nr:inovirus-type Gp2 protein [Mariprofundus ferrooxydans]
MMEARPRRNTQGKKTPTNRKHGTKEPVFYFEGVGYEVDVRGAGIYREIIKRILEQLYAGLETHGKLMAVRFDLHSKSFNADNKEITAFRKRVMVWVERTYQTRAIGFVWVRERETSKHQHYHFGLWIDGNKIQHPKKLLNHIIQTWEKIDPSNHHIHSCSNPFYCVGSKEDLIKPNSKRDKGLVYRLSYLAKVRGKGYRPEQVKDYSASRLKRVDAICEATPVSENNGK